MVGDLEEKEEEASVCSCDVSRIVGAALSTVESCSERSGATSAVVAVVVEVSNLIAARELVPGSSEPVRRSMFILYTLVYLLLQTELVWKLCYQILDKQPYGKMEPCGLVQLALA